MPKQFVPLIGPRSIFQQVIERISDPALKLMFAEPVVWILATSCQRLQSSAPSFSDLRD